MKKILNIMAKVGIVTYNSEGVYVDSSGNSGILKRGAKLSASGHIPLGCSVSICAVIYMGTSPYSPTLSEWEVSLQN